MEAETQAPEVPRVKLGSQGLEVSRLGLGCFQLTGLINAPLSDEEGIAFIKQAFDRGITFFDTADRFGQHKNEILIGKALKQLPREEVQGASKFGIVKLEGHHGGAEEVSGGGEGEVHRAVGGEPRHDQACACCASHPITALQIRWWSFWIRDIKDEIVPLCRDLGIGIVAFSPLGMGFFAGKTYYAESSANSSFHPIGSPKIIWRTRFCMSEEQIWLQSMDETLLSRH
uniref:NADP-dependent oxidoreductase domain-containing protein n=1 Tax=Musa acuminata subsp. malaccensis TaxID=214687 RepID=A0A804K8T4_MUSAM